MEKDAKKQRRRFLLTCSCSTIYGPLICDEVDFGPDQRPAAREGGFGGLDPPPISGYLNPP